MSSVLNTPQNIRRSDADRDITTPDIMRQSASRLMASNNCNNGSSNRNGADDEFFEDDDFDQCISRCNDTVLTSQSQLPITPAAAVQRRSTTEVTTRMYPTQIIGSTPAASTSIVPNPNRPVVDGDDRSSDDGDDSVSFNTTRPMDSRTLTSSQVAVSYSFADCQMMLLLVFCFSGIEEYWD